MKSNVTNLTACPGLTDCTAEKDVAGKLGFVIQQTPTTFLQTDLPDVVPQRTNHDPVKSWFPVHMRLVAGHVGTRALVLTRRWATDASY